MTTIRLGTRPPCERTLESFAAHAACRINHGFFPGGPRAEQDLRVIEVSGALGRGHSCYRRARHLLLEWQMHSGSPNTGVWTDGKVDGPLVTWAALAPCVWVLNPCRVLPSRLLGTHRHSAVVGYATARGHWIAGFEQMTVRLGTDGEVRFEVRSCSRGSGPVGRIIFPLLAPAQHRFFREQVRCMQRALK